MIALGTFALVIGLGELWKAQAQEAKLGADLPDSPVMLNPVRLQVERV